MPLPLIPALIAAGSLLAGGYGVKKGLDAKEDLDLAKSIGESAERKHKKSVENLEKEREKTNEEFVNLGKIKAGIFSNQIKLLVEEISKRKNSRSKLQDFEESIEKLDVPQLKKMVLNSLEIETGLLAGTASGALAGLGAYGSVGVGGGALSAGGLGMAGGTAVLGGFIAGPAIAITGLMMASKAEEAYTKAKEYEAEVDKKVEEIKGMEIILNNLQKNAKEMARTLQELVVFFDEAAKKLNSNEETFLRLLRKSCKNLPPCLVGVSMQWHPHRP